MSTRSRRDNSLNNPPLDRLSSGIESVARSGRNRKRINYREEDLVDEKGRGKKHRLIDSSQIKKEPGIRDGRDESSNQSQSSGRGRGSGEEDEPCSSSHGTEKMGQDSENDHCSVCLNETKIDRTTLDGCTHSFCFICITQWLRHNSSCPLCKQPVLFLTHHPVAEGDRRRRVPREEILHLSDLHARVEYERLDTAGQQVPLIEEKILIQNHLLHLKNKQIYYAQKVSNTMAKDTAIIADLEKISRRIQETSKLAEFAKTATRPELIGNKEFRKLIYTDGLQWQAISRNALRKAFVINEPLQSSVSAIKKKQQMIDWVQRELELIFQLQAADGDGPDTPSWVFSKMIVTNCNNFAINAPSFSVYLTQGGMKRGFAIKFQEELFEYASSNLPINIHDANSTYISRGMRHHLHNNIFAAGGSDGLVDAPVVQLDSDNDDTDDNNTNDARRRRINRSRVPVDDDIEFIEHRENNSHNSRNMDSEGGSSNSDEANRELYARNPLRLRTAQRPSRGRQFQRWSARNQDAADNRDGPRRRRSIRQPRFLSILGPGALSNRYQNDGEAPIVDLTNESESETESHESQSQSNSSIDVLGDRDMQSSSAARLYEALNGQQNLNSNGATLGHNNLMSFRPVGAISVADGGYFMPPWLNPTSEAATTSSGGISSTAAVSNMPFSSSPFFNPYAMNNIAPSSSSYTMPSSSQLYLPFTNYLSNNIHSMNPQDNAATSSSMLPSSLQQPISATDESTPPQQHTNDDDTIVLDETIQQHDETAVVGRTDDGATALEKALRGVSSNNSRDIGSTSEGANVTINPIVEQRQEGNVEEKKKDDNKKEKSKHKKRSLKYYEDGLKKMRRKLEKLKDMKRYEEYLLKELDSIRSMMRDKTPEIEKERERPRDRENDRDDRRSDRRRYDERAEDSRRKYDDHRTSNSYNSRRSSSHGQSSRSH